jgi:DNA processing protein
VTRIDDRDDSRAAAVALARTVGLHAPGLADRLEHDHPRATLADELGAHSSLLPEDPAPRIAQGRRELAGWEDRGLRVMTTRDAGYPGALQMVHDRPALLWIAGDPALVARAPGVAIVGTRQPSDEGRRHAAGIAKDLVSAGITVLSGLAAGIDTVAHRAALQAGGRTIAVLGTGLDHCYPPENAALQAELARDHAVVSSFWPEDAASPQHFRRRNAVMSGLGLGTVIIEASVRSGTRVQARHALAHGRPVFLRRPLLAQGWAAELARRPGVHVVDTAADVLEIVRRTLDPAALTDDPPTSESGI